MKKLVALLLVILLCCFYCSAFAESDTIGKKYTIDGVCTFSVKSTKTYDVFFNQESGTGKNWIVVSFELLNLGTESFYVKTQTDAQIIFEYDFEYSPDYLWANPEGSYSYIGYNGEEWLYVYGMDDSGRIYSNGHHNKDGYETPAIYTWNSAQYQYYNPISISLDSWQHFISQDNSKTVLEPLVERTYHYVFLVPDLVAEGEGLRELIFTVDGEEYLFRF